MDATTRTNHNPRLRTGQQPPRAGCRPPFVALLFVWPLPPARAMAPGVTCRSAAVAV